MIQNIHVEDFLEMKKSHPCGGNEFQVFFLGSDVKVRCTTCGRQMIIPRVKLEKGIKRIYSEKMNDK